MDGQARRADRLCGGQWNLPQADVAPAGLLLPLQRRPNRHQEEKVSSGGMFRRMLTDPAFFPLAMCGFPRNSPVSDMLKVKITEELLLRQFLWVCVNRVGGWQSVFLHLCVYFFLEMWLFRQ